MANNNLDELFSEWEHARDELQTAYKHGASQETLYELMRTEAVTYLAYEDAFEDDNARVFERLQKAKAAN